MFVFRSFVSTVIVPLVTASGLKLVILPLFPHFQNFIAIFKKCPKMCCAITDHVICFLLAPHTLFPQIRSVEVTVRTNFILPTKTSVLYPGEACYGKCFIKSV